MTETPRDTPLLPYAGPATPVVGSAARYIVVIILNSLAAFGTIWLVPLVTHVWSCRQSEQYCVLRAVFFGVLWIFVLTALLAATVSITLKPAHRRFVALKIIAWLALTMAASVVVALFAAVAHKS